MSVFTFISSIFKPTEDLVDNLHTSKEEKMDLQKQIMEVQNQLSIKIIDYEQQRLTAQSMIINAEATGKSWLQRNWRPITMLTFLILVICDSFDLLAFRLSGDAWDLLKIGLGGYVVGRSAEKITTVIKKPSLSGGGAKG